MHEAVEAFKQATERERRALNAMTEQFEQAKAEGLPLVHEDKMAEKITTLQQRLELREEALASYEEHAESGDEAGVASMLAMIQLVQAKQKELEDLLGETDYVRSEIEHYRSIMQGQDDDSPDAS